MDKAHKTPTTAWKYIIENGGLELDGRDEGFDGRILQKLNPLAGSLDDALRDATMEEFVNAFFGEFFSYVHMFRDILEFFQKADAIEGKSNWILTVGDLDLDLEHFRKIVEHLEESIEVELEVPSIDESTEWRICAMLREYIGPKIDVFDLEESALAPTLRECFRHFRDGRYSDLPRELTPDGIDRRLAKISFIVVAKLRVLAVAGITNREELMHVYSSRRGVGGQDRTDAFNFDSILQAETDCWLRSVLTWMSLASELPDEKLEALSKEISSMLDRFPLRPLEFNAGSKQIEMVLSMPIWKHRYEFYAVWIATEIIRALDGHDIKIHHDNGAIRFDFKEATLATIRSSPGPFKLICERKIPLANPIGKGRTANVQPDYQLWTSSFGVELCKMAIEVKHYKRSARRKFGEVLEDYASAIQDGKVSLVNHGPILPSVLSEVDSTRRSRCICFGELKPENVKIREEFAADVRACVGEPAFFPQFSSGRGSSVGAFIFDISGSMTSLLHLPLMKEFVSRLASIEKPHELVIVDTEIRGRYEVNQTGFQRALSEVGGSTDLHSSLTELLRIHDAVLVFTDEDGYSTLGSLAVDAYDDLGVPAGLKVVICEK